MYMCVCTVARTVPFSTSVILARACLGIPPGPSQAVYERERERNKNINENKNENRNENRNENKNGRRRGRSSENGGKIDEEEAKG